MERLLLEAACLPAPVEQHHATIRPLLTEPTLHWGTLLATAIEHKVLCLLADTLTTTGLADDIPRAFRRFLASVLRTSRHKTTIHRAQAAALTDAATRQQLAFAAVKGIALEFQLYGGRGAREFSDLDVLVAPDHADAFRRALRLLGYQPGHYDPTTHRVALDEPTCATYTRLHDDLVTPCTAVDIITDLPQPAAVPPDLVASMLDRRRAQPLPDHPQVDLPVLDPLDHLTVVLLTARRKAHAGRPISLRARADALRLTSANPRTARATRLSADGDVRVLDDLWDLCRAAGRWAPIAGG
ncbi:Nucleotidyltransferase family protein [Frankia sp. AiPs1]|nr:nucleotidyltransferase family protein [Frankia sp. AiPa1]